MAATDEELALLVCKLEELRDLQAFAMALSAALLLAKTIAKMELRVCGGVAWSTPWMSQYRNSTLRSFPDKLGSGANDMASTAATASVRSAYEVRLLVLAQCSATSESVLAVSSVE